MSHHGQVRNIKGGGVYYAPNWQSPEARFFKAGLRHYKPKQIDLVSHQVDKPADYHDKLSYERGLVTHSRSSVNQHFNFHYMYGGFRKYVIERWWINHFYRKTARLKWIPALVGYAIGCLGMRKYDNAAYKFFYFSD